MPANRFAPSDSRKLEIRVIQANRPDALYKYIGVSIANDSRARANRFVRIALRIARATNLTVSEYGFVYTVRFQAVKVQIFGGFLVENPTKKANRLKALLRGMSLSEYGSEGFQVRLRGLSEYVSELKDQLRKHTANSTRTLS